MILVVIAILNHLVAGDVPVGIGEIYKGHTARIRSVAIGPDSTSLFSGSLDETILLWKRGRATPNQRYECQRPVYSISVSNDGSRLVIGTDLDVQVWSTQTHQRETKILRNRSRTNSVKFIAGNQIISEEFPMIRVYDLEGKEIQKFEVWQEHVRSPSHASFACTADGAYVACGMTDWSSQLYDTRTGRLVETLGKTSPSTKAGFSMITVVSVVFSPDGKVFAMMNGDGTQEVWEQQQGWTRTVSINEDKVLWGDGSQKPVAFSPDGKNVAYCTNEGVCFFDVRTGKTSNVLLARAREADIPVVFSSSGEFLLCGRGTELIALPIEK